MPSMITTKYIPVVETREENHLALELGYSLGGHNWYNGKDEGRGYYLYCTPVIKAERTLSDGRKYETISQVLGKGLKLLVKEVSRQSKKAEAEAIKLAEEKESLLIEKVCSRYGIVLKN